LKLRGGVVGVGSPTNKYKFNGMEYQDELGLNVTAMDFRQYDNAIGRFTTLDKLSDIEHNYSPFAFGRNNPIALNDPSGLSPDYEDGNDHDWNSGAVGFDENSKPPSFMGDGVTQDDMNSGNPMGGEMKDLVLQNNFSEGFDKNGVIDLDVDNFNKDRNDGGDYSHLCTSGVLYPKEPILNLPDAIEISIGGDLPISVLPTNSIYASGNVAFTNTGVYVYPTIGVQLSNAPGGAFALINFIYANKGNTINAQNLSGFQHSFSGNVPTLWGFNGTGAYTNGGSYKAYGAGISTFEAVPSISINYGWTNPDWIYKF
jgi:RHS repeat-associated protein